MEELSRRVLIMDGAMGTEIQKYELSPDDFKGKEGCNEYLVITRPDVIQGIHKSYLEAGCDIVETDTFGGNLFKLREHGLEELHDEINFQAAKIAREIADSMSTSDKPRFVAGSIGPTGFLPSSDDPELGKITFDELSHAFYIQSKALCEGGVDALLIETSQDILEVKAAIHGIHKYLKDSQKSVALIAQVTLDTTGRMLLGTDIGSALTTIETLGVDVVGMNCSTGPQHMREPARYLCENTSLRVSCVPNAGLPINEDGKAVYPMKPDEMADAMVDFIEQFGVNIIGGCCGTTPEHIGKMYQKINQLPTKDRLVTKPFYVSSSIKSVSLDQNPKPLMVGERLNAQGSRKVKELLLKDDYNSLMMIARDQMETGAHVLDVCVALTERDNEVETMETMVKKLSMSVDAPLMFDSTDYKVLEQALKKYPGSALINSINMENGRERIDHILPLAKEYGAGVVALTIDEKGMAKTVDRKYEIAKRIYDIYTKEFNLEAGSLLFDVLTFTLATGEDEWLDSAIHTLKAIRKVKEDIPGVLTILGVSNVSFGLKPIARKVLNSVFLYHAVKEGLDAAIVNPKEIIPYPSIPQNEKDLAENLIFNHSKDALMELSTYFENKQSTGTTDELSKQEELLSVEEAIHHKILHRIGDGIEHLIDEAMEKYKPVDILNNILLGAMKDVGDKFGAGELILPFVLQSAEVMKRAVAYLENFLEKKEGQTKASILLATVYGDVHDIGKNLVKTILSNNGYTVHDIGKQVPVNTIIEKAVELNVQAIGLSALLVSTSKQMSICVQELHSRGYQYPVLIGGAAINQDYGSRISFIENQKQYIGGVFYCKDAFEGLDVMDNLSDENKRELFIKTINDRALKVLEKKDTSSDDKIATNQNIRSKISPVRNVPKPPFWGSRILRETDINLNDVFTHLPVTELFRLSWGGRGKSIEEYKKLVKEEFQPQLELLKSEVIKNNLLTPKIIYTYIPCQADKNSLILFDPDHQDKKIAQFTFPRQNKEPYLCLSDYFNDVSSGIKDLIAIQVVTVGSKVTEICEELNEKGNYTKAYYLHGLAVQTAEALAEYNHQNLLSELKLLVDQGKRYSFGYPACPDLEDQKTIMSIMPVEKEIGVTLTDAYQLIPEQSTSAIIIHHPDSVYFRI